MAECPLCGLQLTAPTCRPGPGWGEVHHACFVQVDSASEALELAYGPVLVPELSELREPLRPVLRRASPATIARAVLRLRARGIVTTTSTGSLT